MKLNRLAQELTHYLNIESSKQHINYALTYQYRYYETTQIFKCNIFMIVFEKRKPIKKIVVKDSYALIKWLEEEHKKYKTPTKHK